MRLVRNLEAGEERKRRPVRRRLAVNPKGNFQRFYAAFINNLRFAVECVV